MLQVVLMPHLLLTLKAAMEVSFIWGLPGCNRLTALRTKAEQILCVEGKVGARNP